MVAVAFALCESAYTAQHAAGIHLLDNLLCCFGLDPHAYVFEKTKEGKPYAVNAPFHFSISHSGELCCCALSTYAQLTTENIPIFSVVKLWPDPNDPIAWSWKDGILLFSEISGNVGLDIEKVDFGADLSRLRKISKRYLHSADVPSNAAEFYRMWTRQEAFGKFTGEGFFAKPTPDAALSSFRLQQGTQTYFLTLAYSTQS